jgi:hypothetical protein
MKREQTTADALVLPDADAELAFVHTWSNRRVTLGNNQLADEDFLLARFGIGVINDALRNVHAVVIAASSGTTGFVFEGKNLDTGFHVDGSLVEFKKRLAKRRQLTDYGILTHRLKETIVLMNAILNARQTENGLHNHGSLITN